MYKLKSYDTFKRSQKIYDLCESTMTHQEIDDLLNEGLFSFFKNLFMSPVQKKKLRKLADQLVEVKLEKVKTQLEGDKVKELENELENNDGYGYGKEGSSSMGRSKSTGDSAYDVKIRTLEDKESIIIEQMDLIAGDDEKLQKFVSKMKIEARLKASTLIIKLADSTTKRILQKAIKGDKKDVKSLEKELK